MDTVIHCNIEKNARLIAMILDFDEKGKEFDWYEQHIANLAKYYERKKHGTGGTTMATDKLVEIDHVKDFISREAALASDLIYREDAKVFVRHACYKKINPIDYLDEVPAADVRPVVRGKWIDIRPINQSTFERIAIKGAYNKCSLCGRLCFFPENFCPKCGADMREVQTDG